jgi:hypothetical protein
LRLEIVRQHWPNVEGALRRMRHLPAWAMAQHATITAVDGNRVTLTFPHDRRSLFEMITGARKRALEEALTQVLGAEIELCPELAEEGAVPDEPPEDGPAAEPEATPTPEPAEEPFSPVEQVKEAFPGSTVVE